MAVNCLVWPWAIDAVVGDTAMLANVPEQANAGWAVRVSTTPTAAPATTNTGMRARSIRTRTRAFRPNMEPHFPHC